MSRGEQTTWQAPRWEALKATKGCFGCQHKVGSGFSEEVMGVLTPMSRTQTARRHCYPQPLDRPSS